MISFIWHSDDVISVLAIAQGRRATCVDRRESAAHSTSPLTRDNWAMIPNGYRFSSDISDLDRDRVHAWLSRESYWALDRPRAVQEAAFDASLNFGIFDESTGAQVAYARVVTDSVTFAWLCDVFVDSSARGRGLGVALIDSVCAFLDPLGPKRVLLATGDAHGLYRKFGFESLASPERWMARTRAEPTLGPL